MSMFKAQRVTIEHNGLERDAMAQKENKKIFTKMSTKKKPDN